MKLTIANTDIHQDAEGRFSLNDLHKAAGGIASQRPGYFLENQQTKDLIAEIDTAGIPAVRSREGRGGGSYACKELIYAYAMWISPTFHLQVIRAYDEMVMEKVGAGATALNPANLTRLQLIEMAMQAEQERLVLENKVGELEPKAEALDRLATANGSFCIRDAAKTLQVQEKWLKQFMREHEWIYQRPMGHGWLAYADKLKQGVMEHKTTTGEKSDGSEWVDTQARITAKGMAKLSTLIQEHGQPRLAA